MSFDYNLDFLREFSTLSVFLRLLMAAVFGGIIGIERGSKRRAAGLRTYMLVCLGSALVMITNQYISTYYTPSDPARLGAQVISGIGFLGAGTIIVTRNNQVIGLTTAAGLWASACIGLTVGIGYFEGAIIASVFIFLIITGLHNFDSSLLSRSRTLELYIEMNSNGLLSNVLSFAHSNGIRVQNIEFTISKYKSEDVTATLLSLRLPKRHPHYEVIEEFRKIDGVTFIEET